MEEITRDEVIARAKSRKKTWYSQSAITAGYRQDCSGFVSWCLKLTAAEVPGGFWGGGNTVSLVAKDGPLYEIPLNDLKPGDFCGNCGPGSAGDDGHIVVFEKWRNTDPNNNDYWIYEQAGGQVGPTHRMITWPYPGESRWKAYRYKGIVDKKSAPVTPKDDDEVTRTSLSVTDPQVATWGKFTTVNWPQENTDPNNAHAKGNYPGFVSPRNDYVDLDVYLMVEGMQDGDKYQVRTANHSWKVGKGSTGVTFEYLTDSTATDGAQAIRVQGSMYLHEGNHLYIELMPRRVKSDADAPAPRIVSGTWRIRQDGK